MSSIKSGFCGYCEKQVACKKQCNHALHIVLSFLTCGSWLIIYLFVIICSSFRCPFCGQKVIPGTKDPRIFEKKQNNVKK